MDFATVGLLAYTFVALAVLVDSVVPLVPSEALVVAAAGASASDSLSVVGVVASAALGAVAGDVVVHLVGRWSRGRWLRRLERTRGWGTAMSLVRGGGTGVVVLGRFVPLGRTAVAFTTGASGMSWRRYLPAATAGAMVWAIVMTTLGRVGAGLTGSLPLTLGLATGAGLLIAAGVRCVLGRRSARLCRDQSDSRRAAAIAATSADRLASGAVASCGRLAMASRFLPNGGWGTSRCTARLIGTMTRS